LKGIQNINLSLYVLIKHSAAKTYGEWIFFFCGPTSHIGSGPPHCWGFTITLRHTTLIRTPLDEWSARRRDLYLTARNTHKRQTSMSSVGFKPTIPASKQPQTHALARVATGIGWSESVAPRILNLDSGWKSVVIFVGRPIYFRRMFRPAPIR
jgi:hypothetical protein